MFSAMWSKDFSYVCCLCLRNKAVAGFNGNAGSMSSGFVFVPSVGIERSVMILPVLFWNTESELTDPSRKTRLRKKLSIVK